MKDALKPALISASAQMPQAQRYSSEAILGVTPAGIVVSCPGVVAAGGASGVASASNSLGKLRVPFMGVLRKQCGCTLTCMQFFTISNLLCH